MQLRRAVRNLAYSSAIVIAQAAMPEGAPAEVFEDSFAGGDTQLDWTNHPMFEGLYLDDVKVNERQIPAERAITDIAKVDAGYAGVYTGQIGEGGTAEARVDDFTYGVR
jgi:hypothetical protein